MANRFLTQVAKEATNPSPQLRMSLKEFMQKMAEFNKFGEGLYSAKKMGQLAEELSELCTHAEAYALREDETELFDNVTIKRNMGELKKYVGEFTKIASECDRLTQRSTALYEDMGRVLGRYYEIKGVDEGGKGSGVEGHKPGQAVPTKKIDTTKKGSASNFDKYNADPAELNSDEFEDETGWDEFYDENPQDFPNKPRRKKWKVKEYVDTYGSETVPADEQEKQVKNQPMNESDCPCHDEDDCDCGKGCKCGNGHCECGRSNLKESIFEIQRRFRKIHLREVAYNRNKARMTPEERQAMFMKIKSDKRLMEQITIEFGEKLMKKVENEVPYGDVVKLTTKKFNMNDDCEGFYDTMIDEGFELIAKVWEDRPPIGPNMFIEFYVPKDQFNEANAMANRIAPDYQK